MLLLKNNIKCMRCRGYAISHIGNLFCVAVSDGMGGYECGEVASLLTVQYLSSHTIILSIVYPDAIRAYTGDQRFSHFECSIDGQQSAMIFPNTMTISDPCYFSNKLIGPTSEDLGISCAIGDDTNINAFYKYNLSLPEIMQKGIEMHLMRKRFRLNPYPNNNLPMTRVHPRKNIDPFVCYTEFINKRRKRYEKL